MMTVSLENLEADERIRTADPFITSDSGGFPGPMEGGSDRPRSDAPYPRETHADNSKDSTRTPHLLFLGRSRT